MDFPAALTGEHDKIKMATLFPALTVTSCAFPRFPFALRPKEATFLRPGSRIPPKLHQTVPPQSEISVSIALSRALFSSLLIGFGQSGLRSGVSAESLPTCFLNRSTRKLAASVRSGVVMLNTLFKLLLGVEVRQTGRAEGTCPVLFFGGKQKGGRDHLHLFPNLVEPAAIDSWMSQTNVVDAALAQLAGVWRIDDKLTDITLPRLSVLFLSLCRAGAAVLTATAARDRRSASRVTTQTGTGLLAGLVIFAALKGVAETSQVHRSLRSNLTPLGLTSKLRHLQVRS